MTAYPNTTTNPPALVPVLSYHLSMAEPHTHYFEVEMRIIFA